MSNDLYIIHYGVGHDKGGHSGRYPWGSGQNPRSGLRQYKKLMKSTYKRERNIKNDLYDSVLPYLRQKTGKTTSGSFASRKNRTMLNAAVKDLYKSNPNFRKKVKEAKAQLAAEGKKRLDTTESFVKQYSEKTPNARNMNKASKYITKNEIKDIVLNQNDTDFATSILFDDVARKKRTADLITGIAIAYAGYKIAKISYHVLTN